MNDSISGRDTMRSISITCVVAFFVLALGCRPKVQTIDEPRDKTVGENLEQYGAKLTRAGGPATPITKVTFNYVRLDNAVFPLLSQLDSVTELEIVVTP